MFIAASVTSFEKAQQRASFEQWLNILRRHPQDLLSFDAVQAALNLQAPHDKGLQEIDLDCIVGSVGRANEFTRSFLPKFEWTMSRWIRMNDMYHQSGFEPITVYKVSHVYFVVDGNHRVSVNRAHGVKTIEAYVQEFSSPVPVYPDDELACIEKRMADTSLSVAPPPAMSRLEEMKRFLERRGWRYPRQATGSLTLKSALR